MLKKILKRELCISLGVTDDYSKWYYLSIHVHNLPHSHNTNCLSGLTRGNEILYLSPYLPLNCHIRICMSQ